MYLSRYDIKVVIDWIWWKQKVDVPPFLISMNSIRIILGAGTKTALIIVGNTNLNIGRLM